MIQAAKMSRRTALAGLAASVVSGGVRAETFP
jgi:hypothetical protein